MLLIQRDQKPIGYWLVDNKPDTPAEKRILGDLFQECYVYHFVVNSTDDVEPTPVKTQAAERKRQDYVSLSLRPKSEQY